jgi:hypothetical protein
MNPDHEIRTIALVMTISQHESALDSRLVRTSITSLALAVSLLGWGWSTPSIIAATLAAVEFITCVRLLVSVALLKRAYANHISRV